MKLDAVQEQEMIKRFDRVVWKIVHRFSSRAQLGRTVTKEDLHQEGLIVLLHHIRQANDETELKQLPVMDMWNAMSRLVLSDQPIKFPSTRTSDFSKIMDRLSETVDYSALENVDIMDSGLEAAEAKLDMEIFADSLPRAKRDIIRMRMKGISRVEIAKTLALTNAKVTRELKAILKMYAAFSAA